MKKKDPNKKLESKLWTLVKIYIRKRDKNTCQMCGKPVEKFNAQVSHVVPRRQSLYLKYDPQNLKVLCYYCHFQIWHHDIIRSAEWFINKFPERWKYLEENRNKLSKKNTAFLEEKIEKYQRLIKEMDGDKNEHSNN